jgi:hypothetical protein
MRCMSDGDNASRNRFEARDPDRFETNKTPTSQRGDQGDLGRQDNGSHPGVEHDEACRAEADGTERREGHNQAKWPVQHRLSDVRPTLVGVGNVDATLVNV